MEQNYIAILVQSLEKKVRVLQEISQENQRQKQMLQTEEMDWDAFQSTVDKKSDCIEQIGFLDEGFEEVYQRVKDVLHKEKSSYREEIAALKQLISKVTELTITIQREEQENRNLVELQLSSEKKRVRQIKASKTAATRYYQSMAKLNVIEPQFMDKKK